MEIILACLIIGAALVPLACFGLLFFFRWLAEEDILFTTIREGTVKAIMRGKSFDRFIMSFAGYHLNIPGKAGYKSGPGHSDYEVTYHGKDNGGIFTGEEMEDTYYDDRSPLLRHLGLYWVGWPWANSVYVYAFEWNETITDKTSGEEKIFPRAEATDFIYVADFTYAIRTSGAETKDRLPTDELTLVTVAVRNPYRALFSGEDWMRRITAAINRHVRDHVGRMEFQNLVSTEDREMFSEPIIKLNTDLPDDEPGKEPRGLQGRYGVLIRTADLQSVELSGDAEAKKQNQQATTRVYFAKQEAEAITLKGQAEAETITLRGQAEAGVIETKGEKEAAALRTRLAVIKEHGEAGILLAGYDAIQESSKGQGNMIVWGNNPLAGLAESLSSKKEKKE